MTTTNNSPYSICENPRTLCRSKGIGPTCECGFPRHNIYSDKGSKLNALRELRKKLEIEERQKKRTDRRVAQRRHDHAGATI